MATSAQAATSFRADQNSLSARVRRRIRITQGSDDIRQALVLPAQQDVAATIVVVDDVCHAVCIVALARRVNGDAEVICERLDRVVGALLRAIGLGHLGHDVLNVVTAAAAKDVAEALCALLALCVESAALGGLLAVADEIEGGLGGGEGGAGEGEGGEGGGGAHVV